MYNQSNRNSVLHKIELFDADNAMLTIGADIVCFRKIFLEKLYLLKRNIDIGNFHEILQLSAQKQETCAKTIPDEDVRT